MSQKFILVIFVCHILSSIILLIIVTSYYVTVSTSL